MRRVNLFSDGVTCSARIFADFAICRCT